jgi:hypothetical protein
MWQRIGPTVPFTVTAVVIFLSVIPIWLKFKLPKTVEQPEEEVPVEDSVAVATG